MSSNPNIQSAHKQIQSFINKRCLVAVGSASLAQFAIFLIYFTVFTPYMYYDKGTELSLFSMISVFLIINGTAFCYNMLWARRYLMEEQFSYVCKIPLSKMLNMFTYLNCIHFLLFVFVGVFYSYLVLMFFNVDSKIFHFSIEHNTFLVLYGFFVSSLSLFKTKHRRRFMIFPVIHQRTYLMLKARIFNDFFDSLHTSLHHVTNFIIVYIIASVFLMLTNLATPEYLSVLSYVIFTLTLYLIEVFHIFSSNLLITFCEVMLTRPVEFSLSIENVNFDNRLYEAFNKNNYLLRHLVVYDLYQLSKHSKERRRLLFSLSLPGGHPINWRKFLDEIFYTIVIFTNETNKLIDAYLNPITKKENVVARLNRTYINSAKLRSLSMYPAQKFSHDAHAASTENAGLLFSQNLISLAKNVGLAIANKAGLKYFFSPDYVGDIKNHLNQAQIIVWLVETVSNLLVVSLTEDHFGIVQNDLQFILNSLIELKLCAEKLNRLTFINKSPCYFKMKIAIQGVVKRALYKILAEFSPYIDDFEISEKTRKYLSMSCR